jgi:hypothetical protein
VSCVILEAAPSQKEKFISAYTLILLPLGLRECRCSMPAGGRACIKLGSKGRPFSVLEGEHTSSASAMSSRMQIFAERIQSIRSNLAAQNCGTCAEIIIPSMAIISLCIWTSMTIIKDGKGEGF